ncbi:hypothetical protein K438DRAFT_1782065 [Mycena galopus ATCC 62051]|nr:hypothetical protein K438DRAFT_1782065 [Mycena galopus ATCC 62051]
MTACIRWLAGLGLTTNLHYVLTNLHALDPFRRVLTNLHWLGCLRRACAIKLRRSSIKLRTCTSYVVTKVYTTHHALVYSERQEKGGREDEEHNQRSILDALDAACEWPPWLDSLLCADVDESDRNGECPIAGEVGTTVAVPVDAELVSAACECPAQTSKASSEKRRSDSADGEGIGPKPARWRRRRRLGSGPWSWQAGQQMRERVPSWRAQSQAGMVGRGVSKRVRTRGQVCAHKVVLGSGMWGWPAGVEPERGASGWQAKRAWAAGTWIRLGAPGVPGPQGRGRQEWGSAGRRRPRRSHGASTAIPDQHSLPRWHPAATAPTSARYAPISAPHNLDPVHFLSPLKQRDGRKNKQVGGVGRAQIIGGLNAKLDALLARAPAPTPPEIVEPRPESPPATEQPHMDAEMPEWVDVEPPAPPPPRVRANAAPAQRLQVAWTILLPALEAPYGLYCRTSYGQAPTIIPDTIHHDCTASCGVPINTRVRCLYISYFQNIDVATCSCMPMASLLVQHGVFPGSPTKTQTGISIDLLEIYRALFERSCDAITALAAALNTIYERRGFRVPSQKFWHKNSGQRAVDAFRKSLTQAVLWYTALRDRMQAKMRISNASRSGLSHAHHRSLWFATEI